MDAIKELLKAFKIALLVGLVAAILCLFLFPQPAAPSHNLKKVLAIQIGANQAYGEATLLPTPQGDHLKVVVHNRVVRDTAINLDMERSISIGTFNFGGQPLQLTIFLTTQGFDTPAYSLVASRSSGVSDNIRAPRLF